MENQSVVDLSAMRKPYSSKEETLNEDSLPSRNPFKLFHIWFEDIKKSGTVYEPNAVCLATSDKNGKPSSRMVLLKGYGVEGFKIFTNFESRKGKEMLENPRVSLLFYWGSNNRQIRIEGIAEPLPDQESNDYFQNRPRASQLSARISQQSRVVESRDALIQKYKEEDSKFPNNVPKPDFWGGFRIIADNFEFWQGQTDRLHDRISFSRSKRLGEDGWLIQRLQP